MTQTLVQAIGIAALVAMPLVTFSLGMETGGPQFHALFANPRLPLRYFAATFVVMPALAIGLGVLGVAPSLWTGLALLSIAPPAPPVTRKLRKDGNFDVGLAWQVLAFLLAVVTIPVTVGLVQQMGLVSRELNLTWGPILLRSVLFFGAPILIGLLVRRHVPTAADRLQKPVTIAANVALAILTILALVVAVPVIVRFGAEAIAAVVGFAVAAVIVGHAFGGPGRDTRETLVASLATRFPVPALVLAQANGAIKTVLPVVLVYIVAGAVLVPLYRQVTRRA